MSTEKIMEQAQVFASAWSVVGGPFDGGDAMEVATQEKAELKRMVAELAAERDTLAAKLAELEGQKPVQLDEPDYHWEAMGCGLEDRNITDRYEAMKHGWDCAMDRMFEQISEPLYARPVPAESVNARLLTALKACRHKFAEYVAHHIGKGDTHKADANEAMVAMADVAIMAAEAAPRVARLTMGECMQAVKHISFEEMTLFGIARAIEVAVLRKNGIEVAE